MQALRPPAIRLLHRLAAHPVVYNLIQRLAGIRQARSRLRPFLEQTSGLVLDAGAGTGNYAHLVPSSARYIWLDNDQEKLRGFRAAHSGARAVLADATRMPIRDRSVDYVLTVAVSHHLNDLELDRFLESLSRICRSGLIFLDAVDRPDSAVSRLLWKYDRGSNPRKLAELRARLAGYFDIRAEECYRIYHTYFLCFAVPKRVDPTG